ncbi:hypothetical protein H8356DRAFT_1281813 [Neocallimastix lanati (nom. inval.)]|uniref:Endonuclease/exonuclease/phosphatase domain-containing protein n=1 Tax=Neocallimastix californiae TaxID=1754190 RepID=A0A1Y2AEZ8_9FUNG|nr:hypothetical protein H8356DRAFT_1281813 [Neocallimastix sp. JGI-2020a]ORY21056.1 hypothetical protein LY90DRAFT_516314 [Neocallimastix californiae]|eukprot:ORY21056.1 hypothetical protein LY90DRAFT_516314 [Neocallimastix californiae]
MGIQPNIAPFIHVLDPSSNSITISIFRKVIKAIYLPPSLSHSDFAVSFQSEYHPSLILGDFNVDFLRCKPTLRHNITVSTCNALHLSRLIPALNANLSKLDAAFASISLGASLSIQRCPFSTDHPMLVVSFPVLDELNMNPETY